MKTGSKIVNGVVKKMSLDEMVQEIETVARYESDGHLTIFRFSGGWKAFFGTPDTIRGDPEDGFVAGVEIASCLKDALSQLLERKRMHKGAVNFLDHHPYNG